MQFILKLYGLPDNLARQEMEYNVILKRLLLSTVALEKQ